MDEVSTALPDLRAVRLDEMPALTPASRAAAASAPSTRIVRDPSARRRLQFRHLSLRNWHEADHRLPPLQTNLALLPLVSLKVHSRCDILVRDHLATSTRPPTRRW